ncbi:uncharacterized protein LOC109529556 [Hippocampus comes]|uniref:uncharacterized protein LOC109529556 n=1 Tax=Hippocampus comes TaxID=109280 RepID=UPI00094EB6E4|nr:PREDICTED: uncharacterized protein LOC109529556 [Hippocampus comes]
MHFDGILVLGILTHLSLAFPVVLDTAGIQVQQWVVSGVRPVSVRVLVNGVPYTGATPEVNKIFQVMSADSISLSLLANQTAVLGNHTVLRSRDCILQGPELYWRDRVFCNESLYLSLDHGGAWIAHTRQATALKAAWVQALESSAKEGIFLQETCVDLMEKLKLSEKRSGIAMPNFLIPILSLLAFTGLMALSLFISKQQGLRHPGGVLGSIIHYPKDMADFHPEKKGNACQTL